jgi:hypothetical protein
MALLVWAAKPARRFALVAGALAAATLLEPATAAHTATAAKVVLAPWPMWLSPSWSSHS